MPVEPKCTRPEGPRGQWVAADQVRLAKYNIGGEHINSPNDATHVENLQQALEDIDKEAQDVKRLASGLKDVVLVRRGLKPGGEIEEPVVNRDGKIEIGIWFNEIEAAHSVGGDTYLPVGSVLPWTSESEVPWGWVECDGRLLDKFVYVDLFRTICFHYGEDTTKNRFRVPDLRGVGLLGVPPERSPINNPSGMYLVRDRNRYPATPLADDTQPKGSDNPAGLDGPFDPRVRPDTIPNTSDDYRKNYEVGTLFKAKSVGPVAADAPAAEIPATAFCRWIIKWLDDNKAGIRSVRWAQSSAGWRADLVDGQLRLFHPPSLTDDADINNRPSEWTAENINWAPIFGNQHDVWQDSISENATYMWAMDAAQDYVHVRIRADDDTGPGILVNVANGTRYIDGRFDVPRGWQYKFTRQRNVTGTNAALTRIRKT